MRTTSFPTRVALGLVLAGSGALRRAARTLRVTGRPVPPVAFPATTWGVILRNTTGEPTAALRTGPNGRSGPSSLAATVPAPSRPTTILSNAWQQYDASSAGSGWFPTSGVVQAATGCDQITPCSFNVLKAQAAGRHHQFQSRHQRRRKRDLRRRGRRAADQPHRVRLRAVRRPQEGPEAVVGTSAGR
jgi:hypothetical protein